MPADTDPPRALRAHDGALEIDWADGVRTRAPFQRLRDACPCATCDEARSKPANPFRLLSERELSAGPLKPVKMAPVGHYAYQISWSDGHATGIYTLASLRKLSTPITKDA